MTSIDTTTLVGLRDRALIGVIQFPGARDSGLAAGPGEEPVVADAVEHLGQDAHRPPCPCCGGRMIIVETFERGGTPRGQPPPDAEVGTAMSCSGGRMVQRGGEGGRRKRLMNSSGASVIVRYRARPKQPFALEILDRSSD